jgi:hypothetical protein
VTTTVTVKTTDWPASVTLDNCHNHRTVNSRSNGYSSSTSFVPKNSEENFSVTETCSVTVRELRKEANSLDHHDELTGMNSASAVVPGKAESLPAEEFDPQHG